MKPKLKARYLTLKNSSDELINSGDYYIRMLPSMDEEIKPIEAIIMKCPFCGMDMASTSSNQIKYSAIHADSIFQRVLYFLLGYEHGVTVSPMLQCPYSPSHKFKIKNSRIIPLWQK